MKGNQTDVFGQRIDVEIIGAIRRSAQARGENISTATERALSQYLSQDVELTAIERSNFKKKVIELQIESVTNSLNIKVFGDISTQIMTLMAICAGLDTLLPLRESTSRAKISLFDILINLKEYDKGLFNEIMPHLNRFRKLKLMFTQTTL